MVDIDQNISNQIFYRILNQNHDNIYIQLAVKSI